MRWPQVLESGGRYPEMLHACTAISLPLWNEVNNACETEHSAFIVCDRKIDKDYAECCTLQLKD